MTTSISNSSRSSSYNINNNSLLPLPSVSTLIEEEDDSEFTYFDDLKKSYHGSALSLCEIFQLELLHLFTSNKERAPSDDKILSLAKDIDALNSPHPLDSFGSHFLKDEKALSPSLEALSMALSREGKSKILNASFFSPIDQEKNDVKLTKNHFVLHKMAIELIFSSLTITLLNKFETCLKTTIEAVNNNQDFTQEDKEALLEKLTLAQGILSSFTTLSACLQEGYSTIQTIVDTFPSIISVGLSTNHLSTKILDHRNNLSGAFQNHTFFSCKEFIEVINAIQALFKQLITVNPKKCSSILTSAKLLLPLSKSKEEISLLFSTFFSLPIDILYTLWQDLVVATMLPPHSLKTLLDFDSWSNDLISKDHTRIWAVLEDVHQKFHKITSIIDSTKSYFITHNEGGVFEALSFFADKVDLHLFCLKLSLNTGICTDSFKVGSDLRILSKTINHLWDRIAQDKKLKFCQKDTQTHESIQKAIAFLQHEVRSGPIGIGSFLGLINPDGPWSDNKITFSIAKHISARLPKEISQWKQIVKMNIKEISHKESEGLDKIMHQAVSFHEQISRGSLESILNFRSSLNDLLKKCEAITTPLRNSDSKNKYPRLFSLESIFKQHCKNLAHIKEISPLPQELALIPSFHSSPKNRKSQTAQVSPANRSHSLHNLNFTAESSSLPRLHLDEVKESESQPEPTPPSLELLSEVKQEILPIVNLLRPLPRTTTELINAAKKSIQDLEKRFASLSMELIENESEREFDLRKHLLEQAPKNFPSYLKVMQQLLEHLDSNKALSECQSLATNASLLIEQLLKWVLAHFKLTNEKAPSTHILNLPIEHFERPLRLSHDLQVLSNHFTLLFKRIPPLHLFTSWIVTYSNVLKEEVRYPGSMSTPITSRLNDLYKLDELKVYMKENDFPPPNRKDYEEFHLNFDLKTSEVIQGINDRIKAIEELFENEGKKALEFAQFICEKTLRLLVTKKN